ncbi:MAG: divalent-cation tolerance protein CutA [Leptospiraceae bacterium]|nr:divalent-cation tolerance protein CutA [Leptospiraceae bacterium]
MQPRLIITTVSREDEAENIAGALVKEKLAACVNIIGPVKSFYRWNQDTVSDSEYKLFIKTSEKKESQVFQFIEKESSYDVPEISSINIDRMSNAYLSWLLESTESN